MSLEAFNIYTTNICADIFAGGDKITCVAAWNSCVYVGTRQGYIYQYMPEDTSNDTPDATNVESYKLLVKKLVTVKKPIVQLQVVESLNHLLLFSDNKICVHELQTLKKRPEKGEIANVSQFCVDFETKGTGILTVVKGKKKLQLHRFSATSDKYELIREFVVPDTPLSLDWTTDRICLAYKKEYGLLDINTGATMEVPVPLEGDIPCLVASDAHEALMVGTGLGVFMTDTGEPAARNPVMFQTPPSQLHTCGEYILAISDHAGNTQSAYTLDVIAHVDSSIAQSVPVSSLLPPSDLKAPVPLQVYCTKELALLASDRDVVVMRLTSAAVQVEQYLANGQAQEALALFLRGKPTSQELADFHVRVAVLALQQLQFQKAFEHFRSARVSPLHVIKFSASCLDLKERQSNRERQKRPEESDGAAVGINSVEDDGIGCESIVEQQVLASVTHTMETRTNVLDLTSKITSLHQILEDLPPHPHLPTDMDAKKIIETARDTFLARKLQSDPFSPLQPSPETPGTTVAALVSLYLFYLAKYLWKEAQKRPVIRENISTSTSASASAAVSLLTPASVASTDSSLWSLDSPYTPDTPATYTNAPNTSSNTTTPAVAAPMTAAVDAYLHQRALAENDTIALSTCLLLLGVEFLGTGTAVGRASRMHVLLREEGIPVGDLTPVYAHKDKDTSAHTHREQTQTEAGTGTSANATQRRGSMGEKPFSAASATASVAQTPSLFESLTSGVSLALALARASFPILGALTDVNPPPPSPTLSPLAPNSSGSSGSGLGAGLGGGRLSVLGGGAGATVSLTGRHSVAGPAKTITTMTSTSTSTATSTTAGSMAALLSPVGYQYAFLPYRNGQQLWFPYTIANVLNYGIVDITFTLQYLLRRRQYLTAASLLYNVGFVRECLLLYRGVGTGLLCIDNVDTEAAAAVIATTGMDDGRDRQRVLRRQMRVSEARSGKGRIFGMLREGVDSDVSAGETDDDYVEVEEEKEKDTEEEEAEAGMGLGAGSECDVILLPTNGIYEEEDEDDEDEDEERGRVRALIEELKSGLGVRDEELQPSSLSDSTRNTDTSNTRFNTGDDDDIDFDAGTGNSNSNSSASGSDNLTSAASESARILDVEEGEQTAVILLQGEGEGEVNLLSPGQVDVNMEYYAHKDSNANPVPRNGGDVKKPHPSGAGGAGNGNGSASASGNHEGDGSRSARAGLSAVAKMETTLRKRDARITNTTPGLSETITILRALPSTYIDLIFEFAPWTLARAPTDAVRIFTSSSRIPSLPADKVLSFLGSFGDFTAAEEPSLVQHYLEYLIDNVCSAEPGHHDALVDSYLVQIRAIRDWMNALRDGNNASIAPVSTSVAASAATANSAEGDATTSTSTTIPNTTSTSTSTSGFPLAPNDSFSQRRQLARLTLLLTGTRAKLRAFLQASDLYNVRLCLQASEDLSKELSGERVILQARCGQHDDVLKAYLLDMGDADSALQYCFFVCQQYERMKRDNNQKKTGTQDLKKSGIHGTGISATPLLDVPDVFLKLLSIIFSSAYRAKYPNLDDISTSEAAVVTNSAGAGFNTNTKTTTSTATPAMGTGATKLTSTDLFKKSYQSWSQHATFILEHFWRVIDPLALLSTSPPDIPVHFFYNYLRRVLPYLTHERNTAAIGLSLARMEALQGKAKLLQARRCAFTITSTSRCPECMKLIGDGAVVSAHPLALLIEPNGLLPPHLQAAVDSSKTLDLTQKRHDLGIVVGSFVSHVIMHYRCSKKVLKRLHGSSKRRDSAT